MTDADHESDEALLVELGARAMQRVERDAASTEDAVEPLSADAFAAITEAVMERTAPAANEAPGRRTAVVVLVAVATLAAALVLWFATDRRPDPTPIARYQGTFVGGLKDTRAATSEPEAVARLRPQSPFTWTLVPETAVLTDVTVRIEAVSGEETRCLDVPQELLTAHERGGLEIEAEASRVFSLEPGRWTVRAIVGWPSSFDPDAPCSMGPGRVVADEHSIELLD